METNSMSEEKISMSNAEEPKQKRKVKPLLFIIVGILLVCGIVYLVLNHVKTQQANQIIDYLDGKVFIANESSDSNKRFYAFKNGQIAYEEWIYDSIHGNIDEYFDLTEDSSIFDSSFLFRFNGKGLSLYLSNSGEVLFSEDASRNWRLTSLEEMKTLKARQIYEMCEHDFGEKKVVKAASSCSDPGEEMQVCKKCGFEQTQPIYLKHNYVNRVCSVCGKQKVAEKSDLEANTWYTYNDSVLQVQNCIVKSAILVSQGKKISVQYHVVCQHCHVIDDEINPGGPEVNYEVKKAYYCSECGGETLVRLKME